jgi:oxygen-independent coproporphyrinogen III oxidase
VVTSANETKVDDMAELAALAARTVPRYTSYPTAPHFSAAVDDGTLMRWLRAAALSPDPISVYLHIPFCRSMCHYCGCNTKVVRRDEPIRAYAETLRREIGLVAEIIGRKPVSHIHWGGGTPGLLPPDCMETLVTELGRAFAFQPGMEHAIELDPRHVTREAADILAARGVTRASLGVQDLDPEVQLAIGRVQPFATVASATDALRDAGISALSFDLIYGLPRQTVETVRTTAERVAELRPGRIALFGYAHVPWMKSHQRLIPESALPGAGDRIELSRAAREAFLQAGYREVGIDHFALPGDALLEAARNGRLRRNFQGYTTDSAETLIGLGASSIGRTPFGLVQNASDNAGWRRAVEAGRLPVARGKAFEGEDRLRADVIERLLCQFEADLDVIARRHGFDPVLLDEALCEIDGFVRRGWVTREGRRIAIVRHAPEIARLVASSFDAYLGRAGRHSVAV